MQQIKNERIRFRKIPSEKLLTSQKDSIISTEPTQNEEYMNTSTSNTQSSRNRSNTRLLTSFLSTNSVLKLSNNDRLPAISSKQHIIRNASIDKSNLNVSSESFNMRINHSPNQTSHIVKKGVDTIEESDTLSTKYSILRTNTLNKKITREISSKWIYGFEDRRTPRLKSILPQSPKKILSISPGARSKALEFSREDSVLASVRIKNFLTRAINLLPKVICLKVNSKISLNQARRILAAFRNQSASSEARVLRVLSSEPKDIQAQQVLISQKDIVATFVHSLDYILFGLSNIRFKKHMLEDFFSRVIDLGKDSGNSELYLYCIITAGKCAILQKDINKAMVYFRLSKEISAINKSLRNKAKSYKNLALCEQKRMNYNKAINYLIKMLRMAWLKNDTNIELRAYDLIGLQCYYVGKLDEAAYFHSKMVEGRTEDENSDLRKLASTKTENKINSKSDTIKKKLSNKAYGMSGNADVSTLR